MFQSFLNEPKWDMLLTFLDQKKKILFSSVTELGKFIWGFHGLKVGVSTEFQ
jgi:hypothetical protein